MRFTACIPAPSSSPGQLGYTAPVPLFVLQLQSGQLNPAILRPAGLLRQELLLPPRRLHTLAARVLLPPLLSPRILLRTSLAAGLLLRPAMGRLRRLVGNLRDWQSRIALDAPVGSLWPGRRGVRGSGYGTRVDSGSFG